MDSESTRSLTSGRRISRGSQRLRPFVQDLKIPVVAIHPVPLLSRSLCHDLPVLQNIERLCDRGKRKPSPPSKARDGADRCPEESCLNRGGRARLAAEERQALPVLLGHVQQAPSSLHGAIGHRGDALAEECDPVLPVAMDTYRVKQLVVTGPMLLQEETQIQHRLAEHAF